MLYCLVLVWPKKNLFPAAQNCSFVRLTLWPSLAMWFKRVTVSATHVTSSRAQINKSSTYFNVFRINHQCVSPLFPFQPFCGSHAFSHNRPNFCSVTLSTDSEAQSPLFIKYSWICFSDRHAESTHTFYQTLSKTFSAPLIHSSSYWYMHISMNVIHWYWYWYCSIFANFKIFCAQSESLICCSSPVNPKRASSEFQI